MKLHHSKLMQYFFIFAMLIFLLSPDNSNVSVSFHSTHTEQESYPELKQPRVTVCDPIITQEMLRGQSTSECTEIRVKNAKCRQGHRWEKAFNQNCVFQSGYSFLKIILEVDESTIPLCNQNVVRYIHQKDGKKRI